MSNEEIVKLIKNGENTVSNMELIYISNKPYIYQIAKKYTGYAELEDLMQEAYFGLYEAVQRYEDSHEVKFMTYAGFWIKQAIKRYIYNNGRCIKLPIGLQCRIYQYNKIVNAFESQLNRKPTNNELCALLKMDYKGLESLKNAIHKFNNIESLNGQIQSDDDMTIGDLVPDKVNIENDVIDKIMNNDIKLGLWRLVKNNTSDEENRVIVARYKNNLSLEATGQSIGKTRDYARNLESKALRKLRRPKVTREIKEKYEINFARAYRGSLNSFNYEWTSSTEKVALKNLELYSVT